MTTVSNLGFSSRVYAVVCAFKALAGLLASQPCLRKSFKEAAANLSGTVVAHAEPQVRGRHPFRHLRLGSDMLRKTECSHMVSSAKNGPLGGMLNIDPIG